MVARDVVRAIDAGRVALGVGLVLAPRRGARVWIGDVDGPGIAVLARAHGTREIVLGALALHAPDDRRLQGALACCDAVDLAVTVAARRSLPRASVLVALLAAVGMVGQAWAARRLVEQAPPSG
jgi:hypothetical protein